MSSMAPRSRYLSCLQQKSLKGKPTYSENTTSHVQRTVTETCSLGLMVAN